MNPAGGSANRLGIEARIRPIEIGVTNMQNFRATLNGTVGRETNAAELIGLGKADFAGPRKARDFD